MLTILLFFREPKKAQKPNLKTWTKTLKDNDWVGTFLILGGLLSLLIALQYGGLKYSWSNSKIVSLSY